METGCNCHNRIKPFDGEGCLGRYLKIAYYWDKAATGFNGTSELQWCANAWILALHQRCHDTLAYLDHYSFGPGPHPNEVALEINKLLKCIMLFSVFPEENIFVDIFRRLDSYLKCIHSLARFVYGFRQLGQLRVMDSLVDLMNYRCYSMFGSNAEVQCPHAMIRTHADYLQKKSIEALHNVEPSTDVLESDI